MGLFDDLRRKLSNLWHIIRNPDDYPGSARRERDPQFHRRQSVPSEFIQNGLQQQYNNNNGIYCIGQKRKSVQVYSESAYDFCDENEAPSPKYRRLIDGMSVQKRNGTPGRNGKLISSRGLQAQTTNRMTLMTGQGVHFAENPANAFYPITVRKEFPKCLSRTREDERVVESQFNSWDSSDGYASNSRIGMSQLNSSKTPVVRHSKPASPERRESGASQKENSIFSERETLHFDRQFKPKPLLSDRKVETPLHRNSNSSKTTVFPSSSFERYCERLNSGKTISQVSPSVSTNSRRRPTTSTPVVISGFRKPELITLEDDEDDVDVFLTDSQPKIFSKPDQSWRIHTPYLNRLPPIPLTPPKPTPSQEEPSIQSNAEEDDDLQIIAENIVSPTTNPYQINSLRLENRSEVYSKKSWLSESKERFLNNWKSREDKIDIETKKLAVLKNRSALPKDIDARVRRSLTITDIIVLEPEPISLPPITDEMRTVIEMSKRGRDADVVVTAFNIPITRGDLKTLAPCQWLNDNVINTYMDMIALRSKNSEFPRVHVFSTFFYPKYLKEGHSTILKRWTRKVDIFSMDLIIFPIHLGIHWCLAVADLRKKNIKFYDSLLGNHNKCLEALMTYLKSEHKERKKSELNSAEWTLSLEKDIPTQQNGSDCGVFTCKFAEFLSRDAELTFKQRQMNYYRDRMVYEIVKQELMYP